MKDRHTRFVLVAVTILAFVVVLFFPHLAPRFGPLNTALLLAILDELVVRRHLT